MQRLLVTATSMMQCGARQRRMLLLLLLLHELLPAGMHRATLPCRPGRLIKNTTPHNSAPLTGS
jgi:hypothetical protein